MGRLELKAGDRILFTTKTPNDRYHNLLATIIGVDEGFYTYRLDFQKPGTHYEAIISKKETYYVKLSKLHKVLE